MAFSTAAFWRNRPTLVTGATGLLGSWLVRRLLEFHADVVCLVRDWVPHSELVRGSLIGRCKVMCGDVGYQADLERCLGEYEIESVFHLAAQTIVGIANRNPVSTFETNIGGTWTLLEACRRSPTVKQIIVASSDKAYGEHATLPYTEEAPLEGRHPYDVSKSCADLVAQSYAASYNSPVVITRCGNFYGGGDLNWSRLVPGTIRSLYWSGRPVIRSDGSYIRDYFYIEDAVAAYILLAEQLAQRPDLAGQAFNFSNELQITVLELVGRITELMGKTAKPKVLDEANREIRHQYLSAAKARRELSWCPSFTLEEGLRRTIAWYQAYFAEHEQ
jgi:CDP-glucose 4,6-dehydratase